MEFPDPTLTEVAEGEGWRESVPPFSHAWRGVALGAAAYATAKLAFRLLRRSPFLLPVALPVAVISLLLAWGSAVHLAGGQKYDDQVWHD